MNQILRIIDSYKLGTYPLQPRNRRNEETKNKQQYGLDLFGAYPTILKYGIIPDLTTFKPDGSQEIKLGIFTEDRFYKKGTIVTSPLYEDYKGLGVKLVGSFKRIEHTFTGDKLYTLYHKSIEDKEDAKKGSKWGLLERGYLEKVQKGSKDCYLLRPQNEYELFMCSILSNLNHVIDLVRYEIYKTFVWGHQNVDCLYFDTSRDPVELGEKLAELLPDYDFRISEVTTKDGKFSENKVLFQTYEDLPHKDERRKARKH